MDNQRLLISATGVFSAEIGIFLICRDTSGHN